MFKKIFLLISIIVFTFSLATFTKAAGTGSIYIPDPNSSCPKAYIYDATTKEYKEMNLSQLYSKYLQAPTSTNGNQIPNTTVTNTTPAPTNTDDTVVYNGIPYSKIALYNEFAKKFSNLQCPASIADLQTLFLRILVVANTIVGLVLFFVILRAGLTRMTARSNPEAIKKSAAMITNGIIGLIIVFASYSGLIFLGTTLLAPDSCTRYSFFDSGRILFFFDQSDISPVVTNIGDVNNPRFGCTDFVSPNP